MKKLISLATAAALAGATFAVAPSAEARPGYRDGYYHGHYGPRRGRGGRDAAAAAAAVGVAGALIGGAIAASQRPRYDYYDAPHYYGGGPAYGYGYYD